MKAIVLSGATATGKTNLAITLAQKYDLQIINFDSLLFYRELNIGTDKPSQDEMRGIPHHLINIRSAKNPLNAAQFSMMALEKINTLHKQGIIPLLVGGSGFYLKALLSGMDGSTPPDQKALKRSHDLYHQDGIEPFREILRECDPINFQKLHENDHYRIRRAVEYYWSSGRAFSIAKNFQQPPLSNWDICHIYLQIEKIQHWDRIALRSKKIVENGLVSEVSDLLGRGFTGRERPLQSIGYRQAQQYLNKTITTSGQLIERVAISTRQLAKAQKTFFSNIAPKWQCNPLKDIPSIEHYISHFLKAPPSRQKNS